MIEDEFDKYMIEEVIPSVIAYYIKVYYDEKSNCLFDNYVNSALALFNGYEECIDDISCIVERILKNKFKLYIVKVNPLVLEKGKSS